MEQVTVVRGGQELVSGVDWRVNEGERWVVLGPNGAGKTTLLQIAATRMHPTRGTVTVLGEQLGRVDVFELRPRIGLASGNLSEQVQRSERVHDVVVTAAYGVVGRWREEYDTADLTRAGALLSVMGVHSLRDRRFGTLSSGERGRVLIARALMTDPELLLLDEPAAGLDLGAREDLLRRLSRFAADPAAPTSVLVTHHVEEVPVGTTHALLLRGGKVVEAGPVGEVLRDGPLSKAFGLPLAVERMGQRFTARAIG